MTTAYTSLLGLALPVTGELSGTWGDTVNTAITSLLDTAVAGTTSITTDADITLTTTTGASNQARQAILLWNPASGTTTRYITAPAQSKLYTVINASGGTQSIVIRGVGPTTGVTIAKGESAMVAWNGSDFVKVSSSGGAITFTDLTVTGNTILGDAAADTLTVNATSTFAAPVNFQGLVKLPSTGRSAAAALTVTAPAFLYGVASTYTDTTSSGTIGAMAPFYSIAQPTLSTSNVTTYTNAATLYIANAPAAGGSATITNPYALYVAAGASYFGGAVTYAGGINFNGNVTVGDSSSDTLTINSTITSNLLFTDNTYDIGASGANRPRSLFLAGNATVAGGVAVGTDLSVGAITTMSGNQVFNNNTVVGNTAKFIRGQAYGGAIRFASNGATATDRGLQLGIVDNANAFTQIVSIDGDSYYVSVRGGINSNSTQLQMATDSTTLSPTNFYTISNRGTGTTQTGTYTIGGILFGAYRDVRNPANVAGVWAERVNVSSGLASAGRLYLGVGNGGTNITQDGALPNDAGYAVLTEAGNFCVGTGTAIGRITAVVSGTGASTLGGFSSGNGTVFQIASSAGSGQYMATSVTGDAILRETVYGLCIGTNTNIKFGTTVSEWGRFDTSGRWLVGDTGITSAESQTKIKAQLGTGTANVFNVIQLTNFGTPSTGDIAGIGFAAGEDSGYGLSGSLGFVRNSSYGRGFFALYLNTTSGTAQMTTAMERYRFTATQAGFFTTSIASGLQLQVGTLGSGARGGIYLPGNFNFDGLYLRQATSDQRGASIELVSHTNVSNSTSYKIQASNDTASRVLTFQYAADASAYSSLSYTDVARLESDGSFRNNSGYYKAYQGGTVQAITLNSLPSGQSVYAYTQYIIKDNIGSGGDPAYYYIALCPAYQGGAAQSKAYFTGFIYFTRGSGSAGNNFSACYVSVSSAYLSDAYGGKNVGGAGIEIVSFTYSGTKWLGVRFAALQSACDVTVDGKYASSAVPAIIADASVSSVGVLLSLPV